MNNNLDSLISLKNKLDAHKLCISRTIRNFHPKCWGIVWRKILSIYYEIENKAKEKTDTTGHCIFPKIMKYNLETTIQPSKDFSTIAETRTATFLFFLEVIFAIDFILKTS